MFKKLVFLLSFVVLFVIPTPVIAQSEEQIFTEQEFSQYEEATRDCSTPSLECLVKNTTRFTAMEWICNIMGGKNGRCPNTGGTTTVDANGAIPTANNYGPSVIEGGAALISLMYGQPIASSGTYVADLMNNMGIVQPAYAQGLGFAALDPILSLWKVFRNIAYIFFVVVFLVIGFMIMFRNKMGSTAVTAQQAIPNIIIALITVTFSYAIAGFMIDLMYLTMFMIIGIFFDGSIAGLQEVPNEIINWNIFKIGGELVSAVGNSGGKNTDLVTDIVNAALSGNSQFASSVLGFIGGLTLSLVMSVAVLIGTFKLFFELLKSYVMVTINVVIGPIVLMMGAIPGHNPFMGWLKNIIGNLSAFPTVLLVLVMYYQFSSVSTSSAGFMPPFLIGSGQSGMIGPVMGFAIILAMPEIVKEVKKKLGVTEGGFGFIQGAALTTAAAGLPLGGRLALGGQGAVVGAAGGILSGGIRGLNEGIGRARQIRARGGSLGQAGLSVASTALSGATFGVQRKVVGPDGKSRTVTVGGVGGGLRKGATYGVRAASNLATRAGARQPDWLNPATSFIDRVDPETQKKEQSRQEFEDRWDAILKRMQGK